MYEALEETVKTSSSNRSKYFELLTQDEQRDVLAFVAWLETTDFSKNSVNSYKSYVTRAIVKSRNNETLTNDEKSGVRKFIEFVKNEL